MKRRYGKYRYFWIEPHVATVGYQTSHSWVQEMLLDSFLMLEYLQFEIFVRDCKIFMFKILMFFLLVSYTRAVSQTKSCSVWSAVVQWALSSACALSHNAVHYEAKFHKSSVQLYFRKILLEM